MLFIFVTFFHFCYVDIFAYIGALLLAFGAMRVSRNLHLALLMNLLRVPLAFYDVTPVGRITNRFSKDMDVIDVLIPRVLTFWISRVVQVVLTIIVIVSSTPLFATVIVPLGVLYYSIQVAVVIPPWH